MILCTIDFVGLYPNIPHSFHPTMKFTAEYLKETINFLDVNIRLAGGSS